MDVKTEPTDMSWLVKLTDEEYAILLKRYPTLIKTMLRVLAEVSAE